VGFKQRAFGAKPLIRRAVARHLLPEGEGGARRTDGNQNRIFLLVRISCASQRRMVSSSRFYLVVVKRRAGAVCRAGRKAFCAQHFSRRVRPRARNGRIRRGFIPGPAREPGQGQTESVLTCRTIASASSSPNAYRAYCQRTGASPSYPAASATPACQKPILRFRTRLQGPPPRSRVAANRNTLSVWNKDCSAPA
jgi:hypothetical protein